MKSYCKATVRTITVTVSTTILFCSVLALLLISAPKPNAALLTHSHKSDKAQTPVSVETEAPFEFTTEEILIEQPVFTSPALLENIDESELETAAAEETADHQEVSVLANPSQPDVAENVEPKIPDTLLADEYKVDYSIRETDFEVSDYELKLAATVIQLEVMGHRSTIEAFTDTKEKYTEMLAVAECIRNRIDSDRFPDTVSDVILQKNKNVYQFISKKVLDTYMPYVTDGALAAAREVLCYGVSPDVLDDTYYYFCATTICDRFEKENAAAFIPDGKGSFVKWEGHLTTFYAGHGDK